MNSSDAVRKRWPTIESVVSACYIIVGASAAYVRGGLAPYGVGFLLAAVFCVVVGFSVRNFIVAATLVAGLLCVVPMGPGPIELFLFPPMIGTICAAIGRNRQSTQVPASHREND